MEHCPAKCDIMRGLYDVGEDCTDSERRNQRIENDFKFLSICFAIIEDDANAVLGAFYGFYSGVDEPNLCFGATILGFVVKFGSPEMLKLLLRSTKSVERKHLYKYLHLATFRSDAETAFVTILLDRLTGFDTAKKTVVSDLFMKAIAEENKSVFNVLINWLTKTQDFPGMLRLFEWLFKYLGRFRTHEFLDNAAPTRVPLSCDCWNVIPPYQLGDGYKRHLITQFTELSSFRSYWYSHQRINGFLRSFKEPSPPTPLFQATYQGLITWIDWLLWAGADPRNEWDEPALLDLAWLRGRRKAVAVLLRLHNWDPAKLEVKIG